MNPMNDFVPTHRSKGGVLARRNDPDERKGLVSITVVDGDSFGVSQAEFHALFEPIPKPETVEVHAASLRNLIRCFDDLQRTDRPIGFASLRAAAGLGAEKGNS